MLYKIIVLFITLLACGCSGSFPEDPKPCNYGDTECIAERINYYLQVKNDGESALNLVKIQPLTIEKLSIKQGADNPVNIDLTFSKNKLYGISTGKALKVKGYGEKPDGYHEIQLSFKQISLVGNYRIGGRILILPINGQGKSNMTLSNCKLIAGFKGTSVVKNGETYLKLSDMKLKIEPKRIRYHFE